MSEIEDYMLTMKQSIEFLDSDMPIEDKIKTIKSISLSIVSDLESYYKNRSKTEMILSDITENLKLLHQRVSYIENSIFKD